MQSKSTRGVQQEDVWAAADALIADGLRPTIERVRQKIGRGSPNTVSPMLETWFATLGPRLGVGATREAIKGLPAPVQQAMAKLWETAQVSARLEATKELEQARKTLIADRTSLEWREADLGRQEQVLNERQAGIDEALQVARGQVADLTARLTESLALLVGRDNEIGDMRSRLLALERLRDAERQQSADEARRHAEERLRLEERSATGEKRLLLELDRERENAKRARATQSEAEQTADASRRELEARSQSHSEKLAEMAAELKSAHQALTSANQRSSELRGLLDEQVAAHTAGLYQLNLLLAKQANKTPASAPTRRRRMAK